MLHLLVSLIFVFCLALWLLELLEILFAHFDAYLGDRQKARANPRPKLSSAQHQRRMLGYPEK
jgi:hypothetical protein